MSHRLFFGIRPPAAIRDPLIDIMDGIDGARWQDDDQLHLTLRYLGEVETHQADDLAEAAFRVQFQPFDLQISGTGYFERKGIARAVWAAIEPSQPLARLQSRIERLCRNVGMEPDTRKFTPHITLARLNTTSSPVGPFLARHANLHLGPWRVEDYILYESTLRDQGSLYEPIVTYPAIDR